MPIGRYRILNPTLALFDDDGHQVAHTVPTGAFITVDSVALLDGDKLVDVTWEGRRHKMFAEDFRLRAERAD